MGRLTGLAIIGAAVSLAACGLADPPALVVPGTPASACKVFDANMAIGYAEGAKQINKPTAPRPGERVVVVGPYWSELSPAAQRSLAWNLDCDYGQTTRHLSGLHFRAAPDGPDLLTFTSEQLEALRPLAAPAPGAATPGG